MKTNERKTNRRHNGRNTNDISPATKIIVSAGVGLAAGVVSKVVYEVGSKAVKTGCEKMNNKVNEINDRKNFVKNIKTKSQLKRNVDIFDKAVDDTTEKLFNISRDMMNDLADEKKFVEELTQGYEDSEASEAIKEVIKYIDNTVMDDSISAKDRIFWIKVYYSLKHDIVNKGVYNAKTLTDEALNMIRKVNAGYEKEEPVTNNYEESKSERHNKAVEDTFDVLKTEEEKASIEQTNEEANDSEELNKDMLNDDKNEEASNEEEASE